MPPQNTLQALQTLTWQGSLPLEIRLSPSDCRIYDQADPYLIHIPRLSYLPFLLPRLQAFFRSVLIDPAVAPHEGWFSYEDVPLKWHYPIGLLYDLFSGATPAHAPRPGNGDGGGEEGKKLPWKLSLHFFDWPVDNLVGLDAEGKVMHDAFINGVKEADFLRNGTARGIMGMSKNESVGLWKAVEEHDFAAFSPIYQKLLYAQGAPLRHIPMRIYLPSSPSASEPSSGHLKVVQSPVTPNTTHSREPQTMGMLLHDLLPSLFPSRRTPILAKPVLHGAVVPMSALVEELLRGAAYLDGWLHIAVVMIG